MIDFTFKIEKGIPAPKIVKIQRAVKKVKDNKSSFNKNELFIERLESIIVFAINSSGEGRTIVKKATKQILDLINEIQRLKN